MGKGVDDVVAVMVAIVGVAMLAVIVAKKSDTANVITAIGNAFANALKTALSPVN